VGVWIYYCPTAGDGVVLATVCYNSLSSCFSFPVTCYSLSELALNSTARGLFKAVIPDMHGIHPLDQSSLIIRSPGTCLYTHRHYCAELLHWLYYDYRHLTYIYPVCSLCMYTPCYSFIFKSFFCTLARSYLRPWVCYPKLDLVTTPSKEDQEYLDGLAE